MKPDAKKFSNRLAISTGTLLVLGGFLSQSEAQTVEITPVGQWPNMPNRQTMGLQVLGNYAYVANFNTGLQVLDVSNPASPIALGVVDTGGRPEAVEVVGNYAFVADGNAGLQVIDVSEPSSPVRVGGCVTGGYATDLQIVGNYAYVANGAAFALNGAGDGLQVIDVSNPVRPVRIGGVDTSSFPFAVHVVGNYAYVAGATYVTDYVGGWVQVIDVRDPANPVRVGRYDRAGEALDVQVVGNYAYVASNNTGLEVLDVSNPARPVWVGEYNTSGNAYAVQVVGNYAYVADWGEGLQVIDVSKPSNPVRVGRMVTSAPAIGVRVVGNYAYLTKYGQFDGQNTVDGGFQILRVGKPGEPNLVGPSILASPVDQTAQTGATVTFNVTAGGTPPLNYQWRKEGVNLPRGTEAKLTLNSVGAADSGGYSVSVRNAAGSALSDTTHLAVLTDGANQKQPNQIIPPTAPVQPSGVDSLVLVTHGWEPLQPIAHVGWIDDMAKAIQNKTPDNWKAVPLHWEPVAAAILPDLAIVGGVIVGALYAKQHLLPQHWKHVHLIGHSAGSAVIEAIGKELQSSPNPPVIHMTFLDPYTIFTTLVGRDVYGANADWADNYFSIDISNASTHGRLLYAHNVDVTWLDTDHVTYVTEYCFPFGMAGTTPATIFEKQLPCSIHAQVSTSHGWPHKFYQDTIDGDVADSAGYGFGLSKEGGGWDKRSQYPLNNSPIVLNGHVALPQPLTPFQIGAPFKFSLLPNAASDSGVTFSGDEGANLRSGLLTSPQGNSPFNGIRPQGEDSSAGTTAWLALGVTVTNPVNFVQFDAAFADTNAAEGLLTVYWNTDQIGMVDERVVSPGLRPYRFALPAIKTIGLFTLSFRLDTFNQTSSSATVTNVMTGFEGVSEPITLEAIGLATNGALMLKLTGAPDYTYLVQSSTNLMDWKPTALLVNTNGTVLFAEPGAVPSARYYRATLP